MRLSHRRGAENAEVSQRDDVKREEENLHFTLSSLLLSARPQRSLRLCGGREF